MALRVTKLGIEVLGVDESFSKLFVTQIGVEVLGKVVTGYDVSASNALTVTQRALSLDWFARASSAITVGSSASSIERVVEARSVVNFSQMLVPSYVVLSAHNSVTVSHVGYIAASEVEAVTAIIVNQMATSGNQSQSTVLVTSRVDLPDSFARASSSILVGSGFRVVSDTAASGRFRR